MTPKDLAAEAAWEYERLTADGRMHDHGLLTRIIQAAIKKALKAQSDETKECIEMVGGLGAAHASEDWKQKIADFVLAILHGDEVHQAWLREAGEAFITGNSLPAPRSAKDGGRRLVWCSRMLRINVGFYLDGQQKVLWWNKRRYVKLPCLELR